MPTYQQVMALLFHLPFGGKLKMQGKKLVVLLQRDGPNSNDQLLLSTETFHLLTHSPSSHSSVLKGI